MLASMTNDDEATQQRAEHAHKRRKREDEFEFLVGKTLEHVFAVGKFMYKTIEDILGKVVNVENRLGALEDAMAEVEVEEGSLAAGVQALVTKYGELQTEIAGLEAGNVDQAQIDALTARATGVFDGLATVANTLPGVQVPTEETQEEKEQKEKEAGGGNGAGNGGSSSEPTKSVYVFTGDGQPDETEWTPSGFETTDDPPVRLFYFNGDSAPGETNGGEIAGWATYTGATQPV